MMRPSGPLPVEMSDKPRIFPYIPPMPTKGYRPIIRPKNLRGTVPIEAIRKAVREVRELRNDPDGYRAMVKRYANTVVRIVPG